MSALEDHQAQRVQAAIDASLASMVHGHNPGNTSSRTDTRPLRVALGVSGGRDSMVMLHAVSRTPLRQAVTLCAVHVHHGLSPHAEEWVQFTADACARLDVPLRVERVSVNRRAGESLEALARARRLEALFAGDVDVVALAHHADDQAETVLLQLLRGAGPDGLAAMPATRAGAGPTVLRPLLELPGAALEAYAHVQGVSWIEDESNTDTRFRRNAVRHRVAPVLREVFPGYPLTLLRAARHQAEAAMLLDDLAALDARAMASADPVLGTCLDHRALATLVHAQPHRARNLMRWFLRAHQLPAPSTARLSNALAQIAAWPATSTASVAHADAEIALSNGRVVIRRGQAKTAAGGRRASRESGHRPAIENCQG